MSLHSRMGGVGMSKGSKAPGAKSKAALLSTQGLRASGAAGSHSSKATKRANTRQASKAKAIREEQG